MDLIQTSLLLLFISSPGNAFPKLKFTASLEENTDAGSLIATISGASNLFAHISSGSRYVYKLRDDSPYFTLDQRTSAMRTRRRIDLEEICKPPVEPGCNKIVLTVNVWEGSDSLKASVETIITITDVNDNPPKFNSRIWTKKVREVLIRPGAKIELPLASDRDFSKQFREITYSIDKILDTFQLEKFSDGRPYLLLTRSLDRETTASYTFNLIARDRNKNTATIKIIIIVEDADDNPPKFTKPLYVTSIPEDTRVGKKIFQLNATDPDTGELTYELGAKGEGDTSYDTVFQIHRDGRITLVRPLDYEKQKMYVIPVRVKDSIQSAQSQVRIDVTDVNDCAPEYLVNPARLSILEESDSRNPIGEIVVSDRDQNGRATFQCNQSGGASDVEIRDKGDGRSFEIKPHHAFDREKQSVIIAKLKCLDRGKPMTLMSEQKIEIHITDINDNSPAFNQTTYVARVEENRPRNAHVIDLKARDPDLGENGRITYRISSLDSTILSRFFIDSRTGRVTTSRQFDREQRELYELIITAHDNGKPQRTATARVKVIVLDVNDNDPRLTSLSQFQIRENRPKNTLVGDLTAKDPDKGKNGTVRFTISHDLQQSVSDIDNYFNLMPNGSIFTRRKFDREKRNRYCMSVAMTDGSTVKPRVSVVTVCISIIDENDNKPVFTKPENESAVHRISIDDPPGQGILLAKAIDRDDGRNGIIHYSLRNNEKRLFAIDQITGEIKLRKTLSAADKGTYKLGVMASDQGSPPLTEFHIVKIKVEDGPRRLFGTFDWHDNRNVLIVVILSTVSAFLAIVLISAIICMVRPCGRSRRSPNILYKPATDDTWSPNSPDTHILQLPRVSNAGVPVPPSNATIGMCVDSTRQDCRGRLGSVTGSATMPRKTRNASNSLTRIKMDDTDQAVRMWQYDPERARTQAVVGRIPGEHERDHSDSGRGGSEDDLTSRVAAAGIGAVTSGPVLQTFQTLDRHHGLMSQSPMHPGGPPPASGNRLPVSSTATLPTIKPQPQVVHIPLSTPSSSAVTVIRDCPTSTYTQLSTLTRRGPTSTLVEPATSMASGQNNLSGPTVTSSSSSGSSTGSGNSAYERLHHRFPNSRVEPPVKETAIIDASQADGSSSNKVDAHKLVEEIDNLFFKDMMV